MPFVLGVRFESTCAQRKWTKVFTDAYWNLTGCHISAKICCTLYVSCESELFHDLWFSSLLIYFSYTLWVKQCCNWRNGTTFSLVFWFGFKFLDYRFYVFGSAVWTAWLLTNLWRCIHADFAVVSPKKVQFAAVTAVFEHLFLKHF